MRHSTRLTDTHKRAETPKWIFDAIATLTWPVPGGADGQGLALSMLQANEGVLQAGYREHKR